MLRYRRKLVPNVSELPSEMSKLLYDDGKVLKFNRQNSKITTTYYCYVLTYHFFQVPLSIPLGRQFENSSEKYSRSMFHHNSEILFHNDGVYEKKLPFFSSCLFTFLTVFLLPLFFHYFSTQRPLNNRLSQK